jgi:hypothetical protein
VIVPATEDLAQIRVHLSGLDAQPEAGDLELGVLTNPQYPNHRIEPSLELAPSPSGSGKDWDVTLSIGGLTLFGDSSAPLLYKGRPVETLRFYKAGLNVKPSPSGVLSIAEGSPMTLVLENPINSEYKTVRARLRFQDQDVCNFASDKFLGAAGGDNQRCDDPYKWAKFEVPKYATITLRTTPAGPWFIDRDTGFARSAKRTGLLTLRYEAGSGGIIHEQNIPLEAQLEPGAWSTTWTYSKIAFWLVVGAMISLILRVTIPNYRRKKALKDELNTAAKATRAISDDVESMLRVMLRVERVALDEIRRSAWVAGPNYEESALRVEQGLATLKRKIEYTRRVDAARGRMRILKDEETPPSRLDAIDANLTMTCEALQRDQFTEQDWVFIEQRLEGAEKLLREQTDEEKNAFDALLTQRWKGIRDFFGVDPAGNLQVPPRPSGHAQLHSVPFESSETERRGRNAVDPEHRTVSRRPAVERAGVASGFRFSRPYGGEPERKMGRGRKTVG